MKKTPANDNMLHNVALEIMAAMRATQQHSALTRDETLAVLRKAEKRHNIKEYFRTLLSLYEWRYAFLPIGVRTTHHRLFEGDYMSQYTARQLYIFGVRVARWIGDSKTYPLSSPKQPPTPRLRLRPWRKKRGV